MVLPPPATSSRVRVALGGSRVWPASGPASSLPGAVALALARSGPLAVGCCVGACASALSAVVVLGSVRRLCVVAAFGPGGAGSCSLSAVGPVAAAVRAGASVAWWAGGGPAVPLSARLARRAAVLGASGAGGLVAFVAVSGSRGLALELAAAARADAPAALAFCLPAATPPAAPRGWVWSPASPALVAALAPALSPAMGVPLPAGVRALMCAPVAVAMPLFSPRNL